MKPRPTNTVQGRAAEDLAAQWLSGQGYVVLARNWRAGRAELDLVCTHGPVLVFVEVKMRSGTAFGLPEEAVTPAKMARLQTAAARYMELHLPPGATPAIRFDIVSITGALDRPQFFLLQDVT